MQNLRAKIVAALTVIFSATLALAASATQPATAPTTGPSKFTMQFKDVPLDAVLDYFSQTIGFEVIKEGAIDARVTLMSKQPVTSEEAVTMLTAALRENGFTVLREGRLLHVISRDKAKKGNVPVHFGNNPDDVPQTDELITQVVPIDNINATKLLNDLKALIGPDADVAANEGSNTIIITDTSSNVHRVVEIISSLDTHESATQEIHIIQLKHANANLTAKLLQSLFGGEAAPQQQQGIFFRGMPQQQPQPATPESERHGQKVVVAADERTNSVLVLASAGQLKLIEGIVDRLDTESPTPPIHMRLFTLKYAASDATAKLINNMFKPQSQNGLYELLYGEEPSSSESKENNIVAEADTRTNTVVVTGPEERLEDVERLVKQLDTTPMVAQELRVIHLKNADAAVVAKLVEDMYEPKKNEDNNNDNGFGIIFLAPAPTEDQVRGLQINVTFDERTNILMVSAPHDMLDSIEKVVRELDADPTTEDTVFIYHLRNSEANHLSYTLNVLFGNISTPNPQNQQNPNQPQIQQFQAPPQQNDNGGGNNKNNSDNSNNNARANSNRGKSEPSLNGLKPGLNSLTGQAFVVAEPDTNALLVTTASKFEKQIRAIIEDLDQPVRQVEIKVLVAEVTRDNGLQLGADFSILNERQSSNTPFLTSQTVTVQPPSSITTGGQTTTSAGGTTTTSNFTSPVNQYNQTAGNNLNGSIIGSALGTAASVASSGGAGGLVYTLLEDNVTATIQALQTEGKLDVLSRPYILTSDNQQASIFVGEDDPYVSDTRVEVTGQLVNTIDYRQTGVILNVTPHVNPDGLVVMDVNPQVSEREPGGVTITQGVVSPIYSTRSASAHVTINDSTTIVIGGMMQDEITQQINKIPLLGDLPLLGFLFQNSSTQKEKTELLFFLTPHVVQIPQRLQAMSNDEQKGMKLTTQAVEPGAFDEYMRGMQRGAVPQTQSAEPLSPIKEIPLGETPQK